MKIGELFQFAGRKSLYGQLTIPVNFPSGVRLVLQKANDGYELHAEGVVDGSALKAGQFSENDAQGVSTDD